MILPPPIQAYFDADRCDDGAALVAAFAVDAVVKDEGRAHIGRRAIEAWRRAAKRRYQPVVEPVEWTEAHDLHRVRARVAGNFPGSPATLTFAFRLREDRIASLEIGA